MMRMAYPASKIMMTEMITIRIIVFFFILSFLSFLVWNFYLCPDIKEVFKSGVHMFRQKIQGSISLPYLGYVKITLQSSG